MPVQREQLPPVDRVPHPDHAILAPGRDPLPVGTERHTFDWPRCPVNVSTSGTRLAGVARARGRFPAMANPVITTATRVQRLLHSAASFMVTSDQFLRFTRVIYESGTRWFSETLWGNLPSPRPDPVTTGRSRQSLRELRCGQAS